MCNLCVSSCALCVLLPCVVGLLLRGRPTSAVQERQVCGLAQEVDSSSSRGQSHDISHMTLLRAIFVVLSRTVFSLILIHFGFFLCANFF